MRVVGACARGQPQLIELLLGLCVAVRDAALVFFVGGSLPVLWPCD